MHLNSHFLVRTELKGKKKKVSLTISSKQFRSLKPLGVNGSSGA